MSNFKFFIVAALLLVSVHQIQAKSYNSQFLSQMVQGQRQMEQMTQFNQDSMNALISLHPAYQAIIEEMTMIMTQLKKGFSPKELKRLQTDTRALNFLFRDQKRFHELTDIIFDLFDKNRDKKITLQEVSIVFRALLKNTCFAKYKKYLTYMVQDATVNIFGYFAGTRIAFVLTQEKFYQKLELIRQAYLDLQNGQIQPLLQLYKKFSNIHRGIKYYWRPFKYFYLHVTQRCYRRLNGSKNQALRNLAKLFYAKIDNAILHLFGFVDLDKNGHVITQEIVDLASEISKDTQNPSVALNDKAKAQIQVFLNSLDKNQDKQVSREELQTMIPFIRKMLKAKLQ